MTFHWKEGVNFPDATAAFLSWYATECSAKLSPKIQLADLRAEGRGRGVLARESIDAGEQLLEIPRSAVLSVENSQLRHLLSDVFENLDPWTSLILVMIYEYLNKDQSRWRPYLDILPLNLNTLVFWTDAELDELQGSHVRRRIGKEDANSVFMQRIAPVIRKHPQLFPPPEAGAFDGPAGDENILHLCHWTGSIISSYAFDLEKPDDDNDNDDDDEEAEEEVPKGMIPMADMLNADADKYNARLFCNRSWIMEATRPIPAGEEVLNDFGEMPSSELLREYGYVTENYSKFDIVEFSYDDHVVNALEKTGSPTLQTRKNRSSFLEKNDVLDEAYLLENNPDGTPVFEDRLIFLINALIMSDAAFEKLLKVKKMPKFEDDARVLEVLIKMLELRLLQYGTTLEQDEELIRAALPMSRLHCAIMVRLGEKKVIEAARKDLNKRLGGVTNGRRNELKKRSGAGNDAVTRAHKKRK